MNSLWFGALVCVLAVQLPKAIKDYFYGRECAMVNGFNDKDDITIDSEAKAASSKACQDADIIDNLLEEDVDAVVTISIPSPRKDITPPATPRQASPQPQQPIPAVEPILPVAAPAPESHQPLHYIAKPLPQLHYRSYAELNDSMVPAIYLPRETSSRCSCKACSSVWPVHLEQQPSHFFHLEVGFGGDLMLGTRRVAGLPFAAEAGLRMRDTQIVGVTCSQTTGNGMRQFTYAPCGGLRAAAFAEDELFESHTDILGVIASAAGECQQQRKALTTDAF